MTAYLTDDMKEAIHHGHGAGPCPRTDLRAIAGTSSVPVLRWWKTGFSVAASEKDFLRALVDLYDGDTHLGSCLIVASSVEDGERRFEFKRFTQPLTSPPLDFAKDGPPVAGLLRGPAEDYARPH